MKRTAEITLTSIGLAMSVLSTIGISILVFLSNTNVFREGFQEGFIEGTIEEGISASTSDADLLLNILLGVGWGFVVALIVGSILGLISICFYVGNKKPVAASILAILAAVIIGIGTLFIGFIPAILYLIAGIIGLVRKTPINDTFETPEYEII